MSKQSLVRSSLLSLLLLGTLAATAQATVQQPVPGVYYICQYANYHGLATNPGLLVFSFTTSSPYLSGIEQFQASTATGWDNRKVVFAKPADFGGYTTWEFTEPLDGVQCKA
ncbi:MAG: hypothetical protein QOJ16_308, partial [Acidobacteriota bacterium]|nr:hypothetical protein [Acidobacteriota bacterium]